MYDDSLIVHIRNRRFPIRHLFRVCFVISIVLHLTVAGGYVISRAVSSSANDGSDLEFREFDVDISPEFAGGGAAPALKQEWVEGSGKSEEPVKNEVERDSSAGFGDGSGDYNELGNFSIFPKPLFSKMPKYPDSMRKAGIEGVVIVELGISESGEVMYGKISQSLGREFDFAVLEWAKKIKFHPAKTRERAPMKCRIQLPVRFKLDSY